MTDVKIKNGDAVVDSQAKTTSASSYTTIKEMSYKSAFSNIA